MDGKTFSYSSDRAFNPEDCKIIDNVKANHDITITSDDGRFNISGYAGG